jgi:hypothetical protein
VRAPNPILLTVIRHKFSLDTYSLPTDVRFRGQSRHKIGMLK